MAFFLAVKEGCTWRFWRIIDRQSKEESSRGINNASYLGKVAIGDVTRRRVLALEVNESSTDL